MMAAISPTSRQASSTAPTSRWSSSVARPPRSRRRASCGSWTTRTSWGLRTDATGKTLELVASTEAEANTVVATYPADSLDGRWHHYAANFRTDGANTVVTLYRDYEQVAQSTLNGVLAVATGVSRFYVGGGSAGHLDEIVVWDGEKRADDFLRAKKSGAVLIIR